MESPLLQTWPQARDVAGADDAPTALLKQADYFKGMPDVELAAVAEMMRPVHYTAGEFIFRQGTAPDGLYLLEKGEVLFWTRIGDTRKDIIRFKAGHTLCQSALLETSGRLASCEALEASRAWVLDVAAFQGLRARHHEAAFRLLWSGAEHLSHAYLGSVGYFRERLGVAAVHALSPAPSPPPTSSEVTEAQVPFIRVIPFLKGCSDARLDALRKASRWVELPRGHVLFQEGEPPRDVMLVVRGALEASAHTSQGKTRFSLRGPGRWVGHEAFFSRQPQPFEVVVKENVRLLSFDRPTLDALYARRDPLVLDLLEAVTACVTDQFNFDHRVLLEKLVARGDYASISSDEMRGAWPVPST